MSEGARTDGAGGRPEGGPLTTPEELFGNPCAVETVATFRDPNVRDLELCGETVRVMAGPYEGRRGALMAPTRTAPGWLEWTVLCETDELVIPAHYLEYCA